MFCAKCGKESKEGTKFCMYCGAPLKAPVHTTVGAPSSVSAGSAKKQKPEKTKKESAPEEKKGKTAMIAIIAVVVVLAIIIAVVAVKLIHDNTSASNMDDDSDWVTVHSNDTDSDSSNDTEESVYTDGNYDTYGENTQEAYSDDTYDEDDPEDAEDTYDEEYICSYSAERKFTQDDIDKFLYDDYSEYDFPGDRTAVQMIINEMYARYGYIFKDEQLNAYFNQWEWYTDISNKTNDMDKIYREMSGIEQYNVDLLQENR